MRERGDEGAQRRLVHLRPAVCFQLPEGVRRLLVLPQPRVHLRSVQRRLQMSINTRCQASGDIAGRNCFQLPEAALGLLVLPQPRVRLWWIC